MGGLLNCIKRGDHSLENRRKNGDVMILSPHPLRILKTLILSLSLYSPLSTLLYSRNLLPHTRTRNSHIRIGKSLTDFCFFAGCTKYDGHSPIPGFSELGVECRPVGTSALHHLAHPGALVLVLVHHEQQQQELLHNYPLLLLLLFLLLVFPSTPLCLFWRQSRPSPAPPPPLSPKWRPPPALREVKRAPWVHRFPPLPRPPLPRIHLSPRRPPLYDPRLHGARNWLLSPHPAKRSPCQAHNRLWKVWQTSLFPPPPLHRRHSPPIVS